MISVTLITSRGLAATVFMNCLVKSGVKIEKIYLVASLRGGLSAKLKKINKLSKKVSWRFLFYKLLVEDYIFSWFGVDEKEILSIDKIAQKYNIPMENVDDVSKDSFINKFQGFKDRDDVVLSAYGSQIFKNEMIPFIKNLWNVHGSYLPYFRGTGAYFWMTFIDKHPRGVTLHEVAPVVDTGAILKQEIVDPKEEDTVFTYHTRCAIGSANVFIDTFRKLESGNKDKIEIKYQDLKKKQKRYNLPNSQAMKRFKNFGKKLFQWNNLSNVNRLVQKELWF